MGPVLLLAILRRLPAVSKDTDGRRPTDRPEGGQVNTHSVHREDRQQSIPLSSSSCACACACDRRQHDSARERMWDLPPNRLPTIPMTVTLRNQKLALSDRRPTLTRNTTWKPTLAACKHLRMHACMHRWMDAGLPRMYANIRVHTHAYTHTHT
eukprot:GHVU01050668.1.p1 GENE.GHVU01050668.1~~GHVU01050668.1.p1  ORF type:complete len:154 (-),score=2.78 GHVU01050668.1:1192-1653(-)